MVKAVIFDCFGVLATEAWRPFKAEHFAHDPKLFEQASNISWQADRGLISYGDFMEAIADLAGITPAEAIKAIERNVPDEQLFAYVRELKKGYKLGLLSNVAGTHLYRIFTDDQLALFDAIVLSFQNGFIKPEPEAFQDVARQLTVDIGECVFVDDQERNITGARKAGMQAILYRDAAQLRTELSELLKN
jgi:HAD superfamily hydrolase (TIGR01509 family)